MRKLLAKTLNQNYREITNVKLKFKKYIQGFTPDIQGIKCL
jgi:hypothetical protein